MQAEIVSDLEALVGLRFMERDFLDLEESDEACGRFRDAYGALIRGEARPRVVCGVCSTDWSTVAEVLRRFDELVGREVNYSWFHEGSNCTGAVSVSLTQVLGGLRPGAISEGADVWLLACDGRAGAFLEADDHNGHAPVMWEVLAWSQ